MPSRGRTHRSRSYRTPRGPGSTPTGPTPSKRCTPSTSATPTAARGPGTTLVLAAFGPGTPSWCIVLVTTGGSTIVSRNGMFPTGLAEAAPPGRVSESTAAEPSCRSRVSSSARLRSRRLRPDRRIRWRVHRGSSRMILPLGGGEAVVRPCALRRPVSGQTRPPPAAARRTGAARARRSAGSSAAAPSRAAPSRPPPQRSSSRASRTRSTASRPASRPKASGTSRPRLAPRRLAPRPGP